MTLSKYNLLPCFEKQFQKCKHVYNKVSIISKHIYSDDASTSLMSMLSISLTDIKLVSIISKQL